MCLNVCDSYIAQVCSSNIISCGLMGQFSNLAILVMTQFW